MPSEFPQHLAPYTLAARTSRIHWHRHSQSERAAIIASVLSVISPQISPDADVLVVAFSTVDECEGFVASCPDAVVVEAGSPLACVAIVPPAAQKATIASLAGAVATFDLRGAWRRKDPSTNIEWTEHTWAPWAGCSRISEGCRNCYAERTAARIRGWGIAAYADAVRSTAQGPVWTGNIALQSKDQQTKPLRRKEPAIYFTSSMTDIFHENVPHLWLVNLFATIRKCPQHKFQILTKRIERAAEFFARRSDLAALNNIWLGTSVEDAKVAHRVDTLRSISVPRRWLSIEPLIGPVGALDLSGIGWVIAGGESGSIKKVRPCDPNWVRAIRDTCLTGGIPFFLKQWGCYEFNPLVCEQGMLKQDARTLDPHAKGGALLDGRLWRDIPAW